MVVHGSRQMLHDVRPGPVDVWAGVRKQLHIDAHFVHRREPHLRVEHRLCEGHESNVAAHDDGATFRVGTKIVDVRSVLGEERCVSFRCDVGVYVDETQGRLLTILFAE